MSNNVQSIVCCLGDPVAGNPTQFLMQRAAASLAIDWMFVTAEVPENKIAEAFQGIRALRFSGVAFLPPHQSVGCTLVDSVTEAALRSGHVRVARRDGDLWLGDDTLGAGVIELLRSSGKSNNNRQDNDKHRLILIAGRPWLAHLIRLASPTDWSHRLRELVETVPHAIQEAVVSPSAQTDPLASMNHPIATSESASIAMLSIQTATQLETPIDILILDSTATCPTHRPLAKLKWSSSPTVVFIEPNPRWEAALAGLDIADLRILRPLDVAAAKAIVNFHFWTGHHTDIGVIRESLDEYCQW